MFNVYLSIWFKKKKSVAGAVSGGAGVCEQPPGYSRGLRATPWFVRTPLWTPWLLTCLLFKQKQHKSLSIWPAKTKFFHDGNILYMIHIFFFYKFPLIMLLKLVFFYIKHIVSIQTDSQQIKSYMYYSICKCTKP